MLPSDAVATVLLSVCTHADVRTDDRTHAFAEIKSKLQNALRTLSGRRFDVVSREDAPYGERKQSFLDGKLASSLFFVPVLEPYYFQDPLCRKELIDFLRLEQPSPSLMEGDAKVSRLIVPIHWIDIDRVDVPEECREILKLAASPWQGLRSQLESPAHDRADARPVKKAIDAIARRILESSQSLTEPTASDPPTGASTASPPSLRGPSPAIAGANPAPNNRASIRERLKTYAILALVAATVVLLFINWSLSQEGAECKEKREETQQDIDNCIPPYTRLLFEADIDKSLADGPFGNPIEELKLGCRELLGGGSE